ncbi:hypothetical protein [Nonomuraea sp. bgisy101]|uniref:hypothetical protein n=1 Tax=Nonomuraea sp. bgisy101 TaxID=3413784 RepID=UPI003D75B0E3
MRRYRFGWFAGLVAGGYVAMVVVFGVIAMVGGDSEVLLRTAALRGTREPVALPWWEALPLIFLGGVQGWMLWQVLRGRVSGERPRNEGAVRWRLSLYLNVVSSLVFRVMPSPWWVDLLDGIAWLALVLLFPRVLIRAPRTLRVTALVVGAFIGVRAIGAIGADAFDLRLVEGILSFGLLGGLPWILWMVLILVAQAKDGRWGRTTVWVGAASVALPHLLVPMLGNPFMYLVDDRNGFGLISGLYSTASLLGLVWQARSAHDLASPPARAVPGKGGPVRAPFRWWPLAVVTVALPAVPAVVNLARGVPRWIGPRGVIASYFETDAGFYGPPVLWTAFDVLIGVGGLAVLVLVAVMRRTRRLLRATVSVLLLIAAVGVVSRFTTSRAAEDGAESWSIHPDAQPDFLSVSTWESGAIFDGISPLWYSGAFVAAALLLMFLYSGSPKDRSRFQIVVTAVASVAALCFVPAADQAPGQITTERECQRSRGSRGLTGERSFVCAVRESTVPKFAKDTPDPFVVAYGHRMCGIYTRNDPQELAQVRRTEGVEVRSLTYPLAGICPSAAAIVKAEGEREDREMREWEAMQQRICDESPRHRPLTKPVSVVVQPEPVWTDYGNLEAFEPEITEDPYEAAPTHEDELVRVAPGHLAVTVHSDVPLCVTTETYNRRPPVEAKGWHHVVEVGYNSVSGEIEMADPMGGDPLPNLAVRGKGHYRIRVHYAWLTFEGEKYAGQRLLIMAYPGQGDDVVVHRERVKP